MRIAVCRPQVAFVRGGAEIFTDKLVEELRARGHDADLVTIPYQTWPNERLLTSGLMWRLVDLEVDAEISAELVIATKYPSYLIQHSNKVVWLVHQLRQAYELDRTELGQLDESVFDHSIRQKIQAMDRVALGGARKLFATSRNVAERLRQSTGLEAQVLPHPPQDLAFRCDSYQPFVLSVGRLDRRKRIDLLLEAATHEPELELVIVGEGPDRERLEELSANPHLNGRVRFTGNVPEAALAELYATCRVVYYAPVDEDFGMVPFEAFRSGKAVVTTTDSGGPLDIVGDRKTGRVTDPDAAAVAAALKGLIADEATARAYGEAGRDAVENVNWDVSIDRLLG
jgi:glycosyltransferase involved in cell wall biosynthesis